MTAYDARYETAKATGDRRARERGWDFSNIDRDLPLFWRAAEVCLRPTSLCCFVVLGVCLWAFTVGG